MVIMFFLLGIAISVYIAHMVVRILNAPFLAFLTDVFDEQKARFWQLLMKMLMYLIVISSALSPRAYYQSYSGQAKNFEGLFWGLVESVKSSIWRLVMVLLFFFLSFLITSAFLKKEKETA
jgi:hypothetical protein